LSSQPQPPSQPKAIAFFDGQNLYHSVKRIFGYTYPNYNPKKLSQQICAKQDWQLAQTRFYTGIPRASESPFWNHFWRMELAKLGVDPDIHVFSRDLHYRNESIELPNGQKYSARVGREKGIDVRIAIDIIRLAYRRLYDVALIFSQDQDFAEVAAEILTIGEEQDRWIKIACAFPMGASSQVRGINNTDWIKIDRSLYELCLDPNLSKF
jgi:uncharacterized LabA/DUF88 family protein